MTRNFSVRIIAFDARCNMYISRKDHMLSYVIIMYLVDQSKPCAQIYLPKNCMLRKFAITNTIFCLIYYFRHASSHNVHVYQFSSNLGQEISQNRARKYIYKKLQVA